jgi:hypothetical protein
MLSVEMLVRRCCDRVCKYGARAPWRRRSVQSCCLASYSQPAAPHRAGLLEPGLFHQPAPLEDVNVLVERFLSGAHPQLERAAPVPCANAQPKQTKLHCLLRTAGRHAVQVHSLPLTCSWLSVF